MPVIKTMRNKVVADDPGPDDTHVQVVWFGPSQDGKHRKVFEGPIEPIENYEEAVAWAVEKAAQMVFPLYVVPMGAAEVLRTSEAQNALAMLSDQERGELRQAVAAMLGRIMRDCDDPEVRADAHEVLVQMKVVKP